MRGGALQSLPTGKVVVWQMRDAAGFEDDWVEEEIEDQGEEGGGLFRCGDGCGMLRRWLLV